MGKFAAALLGIACLVSCSSSPPASPKRASSAQTASAPDPTLVPPQTVRIEKVVFANGVKNLTVSNAEGRYALACNSELDSCVTPTPGKDYLLFTKSTNWKFPGATGYITLEWIQKWSLMELTRAGGAIGIPGLYVTDDPGAKDSNARKGVLGLRIGLGWAKSHSFETGQCPVLRYNRQLMMAILHDKVNIAKAVNVEVLPLEDAPRGYHDFDTGAAKKFVLDPHGIVRSRRAGAELAAAGV